jgi:predicted TIM-barrel fold metal-dependent hydrolase
MRRFEPKPAVRDIRSHLDHPIVDADGHQVEFMPLVIEEVARVLGAEGAERFVRYVSGVADPEAETLAKARVFWGLPEENTLDRMTSTLPRLLYERLDALGLDYVLLYPTVGLTILGCTDAELRRASSRALNTYYAEAYADYRDRLEPVAVIPSFTPEEAIAELDHAVGTLGLKAIVTSGVVPRDAHEGEMGRPWIDTLGHASLHDYDPLWARCLELGVVPAFHGIGYGWGSRVSRDNYVYNHLGSFGVAQEAVCRSLVMGGAPARFPGLPFAFLEGGTAWGCQLYADLLGHFEKRNKDAVLQFDPKRFDLDLCRELMSEFADAPFARKRDDYEQGADVMRGAPLDVKGIDDFAESGIGSLNDITRIFEEQFHFGCEADDPMNALAFDRKLLPRGARLNAMFASDIGHWDVPDMTAVLPEAWELVDRGLLDRAQFADFTCGNAIRMLTSANPRFFDGTVIDASVVADAARRS